MQRNISAIAGPEFDLIIVGGGAFGAAAARDATLRGLRTALIERHDFGAGASAECFKMVHGGIRYLQHADLKRLRHSCRERSAFLRIAPHLVSPLPIAIPTYGSGRRGKLLLGAGASLYDLLTFDRNAAIRDPQRQIGRTRFLSRSEILRNFPHLQTPDLSGAVVFQDGQMYNPARLVLAFVKSAAAEGAVVCNYLEATEFLWSGSSVCGVKVRDRLNNEEFDIRARLVLNAAGPWAEYLFGDSSRFGVWQRRPFSRDAYFIVNRKPESIYALAVQGLSSDKDARFGRAKRHLFAVPWRNRTLFGVWHRLHPQLPDTAHVEAEEIQAWMDELNTVYPQLQLSPAEVSFAHCGLVPFGETATHNELSFGKESQIIDHRRSHGIDGLVSIIGIRFTTARADAALALQTLLRQWPNRLAPAPTDRLPLIGGNIQNFAAFRREAGNSRPQDVPEMSFDSLLRNHGTEYRRVINALKSDEEMPIMVPGTGTLTAEILHSVQSEMAVRLEDVILRRTELGTQGHPGHRTIQFVAHVMAAQLKWSTARISEEIAQTERCLLKHHAVASKASQLESWPAGANAGLTAHASA